MKVMDPVVVVRCRTINNILFKIFNNHFHPRTINRITYDL